MDSDNLRFITKATKCLKSKCYTGIQKMQYNDEKNKKLCMHHTSFTEFVSL